MSLPQNLENCIVTHMRNFWTILYSLMLKRNINPEAAGCALVSPPLCHPSFFLVTSRRFIFLSISTFVFPSLPNFPLSFSIYLFIYPFSAVSFFSFSISSASTFRDAFLSVSSPRRDVSLLHLILCGTRFRLETIRPNAKV